MPFPLAHPAAVLPLRRYCPRWLNLPALIIGSLTPDAGYFFSEQHLGTLSHRFTGGFIFCLPLGVLLAAAFFALRTPAVKLLPRAYQEALLPWCRRGIGSFWIVLLSLLVGIWSHQLWDSFTHRGGWAVVHLPLLQEVAFTAFGRTARVCHLLWYGCSFAGVIWVFLAFEKWKQSQVAGAAGAPTRTVLRDAVLVALLVLPIQLAHHLVQHRQWRLMLVAAVCAVPVGIIVLRVRRARQDMPA
jgi:hypothetical protein